MLLTIVCPSCDREQDVFAQSVGKSIPCRFCATRFEVAAPGGKAKEHPSTGPRPESGLAWDEPEVLDAVLAEDESEEPLLEAIAPVARTTSPRRPLPVRRKPRLDLEEPLRTHGRPWYLFVLALLPLAIPLLAYGAARATGLGMGPLGIILWTTLGVLLTGGCFLLALPEGWYVVVRVLLSLGLTALGWLAVLGVPLAALIGSVGKIDPSEWKEFAPPGGRCAALMPGSPKHINTKANSPVGPIDCEQFVVERSRGSLAFFVAFSDVPAHAVRVGTDQDVLNGMRDGAASSAKGQVVSESAIVLSGYAGKELEIRMPGNTVIRARHYVVQRRMYQVMVASTNGRPADDDVKKFFDSFKLTGTPAAKEIGKPVPPKPPAPPQPQPEEPRPLRPGRTPLPATKLPGLIACWTFEGGGDQVSDVSGKASRGTLRGARRVKGLTGQAARFNGAGDYFDYGTAPGLNFGDQAPFTFAGWFQTVRGGGMIVSQRNNRSGAPVIDIWVEGGRLCGLVRDDRNEFGAHAQVTGGPAADGEWHHFALTRTGGTIELFLDGAAQGKVAGPQAGGPITTDLRAVGAELYWVRVNYGHPESRHFQGWVDEFCVFDRALAASEIRGLAAVGP